MSKTVNAILIPTATVRAKRRQTVSTKRFDIEKIASLIVFKIHSDMQNTVKEIYITVTSFPCLHLGERIAKNNRYDYSSEKTNSPTARSGVQTNNDNSNNYYQQQWTKTATVGYDVVVEQADRYTQPNSLVRILGASSDPRDIEENSTATGYPTENNAAPVCLANLPYDGICTTASASPIRTAIATEWTMSKKIHLFDTKKIAKLFAYIIKSRTLFLAKGDSRLLELI
ncbi:30S ribosomal protein S15 [Trichinella spiralis]|uniref:30S ribosomal protein S15 n=1 Tax=Trichinella spiralis TaxID=6334 RepID=UPI0001EFBE0D|nr:30S ribosomal protein S15 [Trichinella spiralis]